MKRFYVVNIAHFQINFIIIIILLFSGVNYFAYQNLDVKINFNFSLFTFYDKAHLVLKLLQSLLQPAILIISHWWIWPIYASFRLQAQGVFVF